MIHILIVTIIGALIGWITNYIAVTMLFRPYKKVWIFQGVIPAEIERLALGLSDGAVNFAEDMYNDEKIQNIIDNAIDDFNEKLPFWPKISFMLGLMGLFGFGKGDRVEELVKEDGFELLRNIIYTHVVDMDMHGVEVMIRKVLNKEFRMIELYGLIFGGILGGITSLVLTLI